MQPPGLHDWADIEEESSEQCEPGQSDWAWDETDDMQDTHDNADNERGTERVPGVPVRIPVAGPVPAAAPVGGVGGAGGAGGLGGVEERLAEVVRAVVEGEDGGAHQQVTFAAQRGVRAAILWALRGRHGDPDHLLREGGGRGRGEEIDNADGDVDLNLGRGDGRGGDGGVEAIRAREAVIEEDRRNRFAEVAVRGAQVGANARNTSDSRTRRRGRITLMRDRLHDRLEGASRRNSSDAPRLWLHTVLNPEEHPRDFISVVVVDSVLKECVSALDSLAMDLVSHYETARQAGKRKEERSGSKVFKPDKTDESPYTFSDSNKGKNRLTDLALDIVSLLVRSPYRGVLVPGVFRVLLVHCGLRVKWAATEALKRCVPLISSQSIPFLLSSSSRVLVAYSSAPFLLVCKVILSFPAVSFTSHLVVDPFLSYSKDVKSYQTAVQAKPLLPLIPLPRPIISSSKRGTVPCRPQHHPVSDFPEPHPSPGRRLLGRPHTGVQPPNRDTHRESIWNQNRGQVTHSQQ